MVMTDADLQALIDAVAMAPCKCSLLLPLKPPGPPLDIEDTRVCGACWTSQYHDLDHCIACNGTDYHPLTAALRINNYSSYDGTLQSIKARPATIAEAEAVIPRMQDEIYKMGYDTVSYEVYGDIPDGDYIECSFIHGEPGSGIHRGVGATTAISFLSAVAQVVGVEVPTSKLA